MGRKTDTEQHIVVMEWSSRSMAAISFAKVDISLSLSKSTPRITYIAAGADSY